MPVSERGFDKFNEYLASKGFSKSTISTYLYHVNILNKYFKDNAVYI